MRQNDFNYIHIHYSQNSEEIIKYTNWESLKCYNLETANCLLLFRTFTTIIIEPQYLWKDKFEAITELRSIHKSIKSLFFSIFSITSDSMKLLLIESKTYLTKNILLFLRELFSEFYDETSIEAYELLKWLKEFIPVIITKTTSGITFIKNEACNCLYAITENMLYFDVLIIFLEGAMNKNKEEAKVSFQAFEVLYSNIDKTYLREYLSFSWSQMLDIVIQINKMKGVVYENIISRFLMLISPIWNCISKGISDENKEAISSIYNKIEIIVNSKSKKKSNCKHKIQLAKINNAFNKTKPNS